MTKAIAEQAENGTQKVNVEKWSKPVMDAGWTTLPNIMFEKQAALGLDPIDINIIGHLSTYWWKKTSLPHPSVATIAAAIGIKTRTVQKHIKKMEDLGFMKRTMRQRQGQSNNTNLYDFDGLIKILTPYAKEKVSDKAKKQQDEADRLARKKPKLTVVPN